MLEKIKSIQFSLLKKDTDINEDNQAEFLKEKTASFRIPDEFPRDEESFNYLTEHMFKSLINNISEDIYDYLGLWIEYDEMTVDNAISIDTLKNITEYTPEGEVNAVYEFFKMTVLNYDSPLNLSLEN